jgi:rare lipoprotein A
MRAHAAAIGRLPFLGLAIVVVGCTPKSPPPREPTTSANVDVNETDANVAEPVAADGKPDEVGLASWYGSAFAGRRTSSGERFDPKLFTAAHKKLPFGTWVEVRRVDTGRAVRVRINDRGPNGHAAHRIIDLSQRAAQELDIIRAGVVRVELRVIRGP